MKSTTNIKKLLDLLKPLSYFSKDVIYEIGSQLELKDTSIDVYISRFLKHKEILQLKNGLYISADFFNKNKGDVSYIFYLANILRKPSYVSSWTALQYYGLTTEAIYIISSVTPKVTRDYKTKAGNFRYQSIKKDLFSDFNLVKGKFEFYIASPAKALFDLLYFKTHQFRGIELKDVRLLIDELRIDFDEMKNDEQEKFYKMVKKYYE